VTTNVLELKDNEPVHFQICSKDVIHSFWVPEFRLKEDAVPGKTTSIRLKPNRVGHYTVVCTELCGLGHSTMRSPVAVVSDQEFTAWLQRQTQPAPGAAPPASGGGGGGGGGGADLAQGKQLFTANGCGGCHTLADRTWTSWPRRPVSSVSNSTRAPSNTSHSRSKSRKLSPCRASRRESCRQRSDNSSPHSRSRLW
jgi:hypothetical protein